MRPILAAVISFAILGGLWVYTQVRPLTVAPLPAAIPEATAAARYAMDVTMTFSAEPDPFALTVDADQRPAALLVRFNGQELLRVTERLSAGDPITVDPLPGAVVGRNELFLEAAPPIKQGNRAHAVRIRILRDGVPFAEETFWSEPGTRLSASFPFTITDPPAATTPKDHEH